MFAIRTHAIIKHRSRCTLNLYAVDVNGGSLHKQKFVRKLILEFLVESFPFQRENKIIPTIFHLLVLMIVHVCVVTLILSVFCELISKKTLHVV